jgi:hypothetical protein
MGAKGSTRWKGHTPKLTLDQCFELRASDLAAGGVLPLPRQVTAVRGDLCWYMVDSPYKFPALSASYWLGELGYGDYRTYRLDLSIGFAWVCQFFTAHLAPSRVGPARWMFYCPDCRKSVAALYTGRYSSRFACRRCQHLTYASTRKKEQRRTYRLEFTPPYVRPGQRA